jgi:hypothetical protein
MATFSAGNDADAHCVEGDQVLGLVILVTVQGPEKSCPFVRLPAK